ncbi:hypothetical protein ACSLBF_10580 [Pseudoalteromonas sp. T1lg65]|uniref:hypothetical protein n=1 Tax=Pseudoalteromonas sp. T1lg65 TaxID=2077101 RepID=UPI003F79A755
MKFALLATLISLGSNLSAHAQQLALSDAEWLRTEDSHYSFYTSVNGAHKLEAQAFAYNNQIDFRLVWTDEKTCKKYRDGTVFEQRIYLVNDQQINFAHSCHGKKLIAASPFSESGEGNQYVLSTFDKAKGEPVKFVLVDKTSRDKLYMIPSKGFTAFYTELKKATKEAL